VSETDDLNGALGDQLLHLQVLYHPSVQIVDQMELEVLQTRLLKGVFISSVKNSEDSIGINT
jgi:hypothetical protein